MILCYFLTLKELLHSHKKYPLLSSPHPKIETFQTSSFNLKLLFEDIYSKIHFFQRAKQVMCVHFFQVDILSGGYSQNLYRIESQRVGRAEG